MSSILRVAKKIIPEPLVAVGRPVYHFILAWWGAVYYRFPSEEMIVIGVTGTNGKTTVVHLLSDILSASDKTAHLSSVSFRIGSEEKINTYKMTLPGRLFVQHFLRQAADAGCKYVVLEITSEGIAQSRHRFINFDIAVFTNLSQEHIERHGSFARYRQAKQELFRATASSPKKTVGGRKVFKAIVVNADDPNADRFTIFDVDEYLGFSSGAPLVRDRVGRPIPLLTYKNVSSSKEGTSFSVNGSLYFMPLFGRFNVENAVASIAVASILKINSHKVREALRVFHGVSGRLEVISKNPLVVVDYAHTPAALQNLYQAVHSGLEGMAVKKMICVLGSAGGGRDKWKRPELGALADQWCDNVIITNEDPYDENPQEIMRQVAQGVQKNDLLIIPDRREAIRKALNMAQKNDAVVISGKGSEPWMMVGKEEKIPWDDRQIVREELEGARPR